VNKEARFKVITWITSLMSIVLLSACPASKITSRTFTRTVVPLSPGEPTWTPLPAERDRWPELLGHTPIPWTTPLPPLESTVLDGTYVKDDPLCQWDVGEYTWQLEDGQLRLTEVDDPCSTSFRLRAANLTKQDWLVCQSSEEAWSPPPGCPPDPP
jgi:hypothetical protein